MGVKNKIIILTGIVLCPFSFFFILVKPVIGILLLLLAIFLIYKGITMKEKLSKKDISALLFIALANKMNNNKNEFLDLLKEEKDYNELNKLFKDLDYCIEKYVRNLATLNFTPKRPINPYVAAGIGSSIAGTAGAIISYNDASNANEEYLKELEAVNKNHNEYNQSLTDFESCFYNIEDILLKYDKTRKKWVTLKEETIKEEMERLNEKRIN